MGIEELIREFLNEEVQDDEIENSIWLFFGYLSDDCDIEDIEEVDRETIEEFLSWWYLQDPLIMSAERAAYLMVSLVIFFDWLYVRYGNELIGDVKDVCHELVKDLPRVLMVDWSEIAPDATDPSDIDRDLEAEYRAKGVTEVAGDYFEIAELNLTRDSMCLEDIYTGEKFQTKVTEVARGWLKEGDILRGDIGKIGDRWVIVDFWGIYPHMAKWYIIG